MSAADRGKWAEGQVRDVLTEIENTKVGFTFNRIPDAHGGFMQPAAADFQWFYWPAPNRKAVWFSADVEYTLNGIVEVKEVEHLFRLDHGNFSKDKIARGWKRHLAGCESLVLIAHKLKGMRKGQVTWRAVPLKFFHDTEYVKGVGSWDLRAFPLIDMEKELWRIADESR